MKKALAFWVSFLSLSSPAIAQDYAPRQLSTFLLSPNLTLSQEYTDNVLASEINEQSDFITTVKPQIAITKSIRDHTFEFLGEAEILRHARVNSEDIENYYAGLKGNLVARRALHIPFELSYRVDHRNRNEERLLNAPAEPVEFATFRSAIGLEYQPRGRFFASLQLSHERERFENTLDGAGNALIRLDEDADETRVTSRIGYEASPHIKPFVELTYGMENFLRNAFVNGTFSGRNGDNNYVTGLIGAAFDNHSTLSGELAAGFTHQRNDEAGEDDINTLALAARLNWQPIKPLQLSLIARRDVDEDPTIFSRITRSDLSINALYDLTPRIDLNFSAAIGSDDFEDSTRGDDRSRFSAGLDYTFSEKLSGSVLFNRAERDSNAFGQSFNERSVVFQLNRKF